MDLIPFVRRPFCAASPARRGRLALALAPLLAGAVALPPSAAFAQQSTAPNQAELDRGGLVLAHVEHPQPITGTPTEVPVPRNTIWPFMSEVMIDLSKQDPVLASGKKRVESKR